MALFDLFQVWVINPEVIDTEVYKTFFSAKHIFSLVQNALHLVLIVSLFIFVLLLPTFHSLPIILTTE